MVGDGYIIGESGGQLSMIWAKGWWEEGRASPPYKAPVFFTLKVTLYAGICSLFVDD